jgi:formylglycine-generating enzyme required for sulfatase activity
LLKNSWIALIAGFFMFLSLCPVQAYSQMEALPHGSFYMGSISGSANATPRRKVEMSAFFIDKYEVTYSQYEACVKSRACTPAHYDDGKCIAWDGSAFRNVTVTRAARNPSYPVVCVTWEQARRYCEIMGKRLPTEAQWEYAATGGKNFEYSWGNEAPEKNRCVMQGSRHPEKPGTFGPNSCGLYDMTGNVWEWTNDHYQADYYSTGENIDPKGPEVGQYRVVRGGGWYSSGEQLSAHNRYWFDPFSAETSIGFRCAK